MSEMTDTPAQGRMADLTRDEILAMPAGPEMDALVAERVMKWHKVWVRGSVNGMSFTGGHYATEVACALDCDSEQRPMMLWRNEPGSTFGRGAEWNPSYDIAPAWDVLERLRSVGYLVKVQEMPDGIPWLANRADEPDMPVRSRAYVALSYIAGRTSEKPEEVWRYVHEHTFAIEDNSALAICRAALLLTLTEPT